MLQPKMIEHVREYTKSEAFQVLKTKWNLFIAKLYAFIGLLYAYEELRRFTQYLPIKPDKFGIKF